MLKKGILIKHMTPWDVSVCEEGTKSSRRIQYFYFDTEMISAILSMFKSLDYKKFLNDGFIATVSLCVLILLTRFLITMEVL